LIPIKQSTRALAKEGPRQCKAELGDGASAPGYLLAARRLAAHLAFIASESFFLPAAVSPPFFLAGALAGANPFRWAHRALAAAASFARVAADIGRRLLDRLREAGAVEAIEPPPAKSEANRRSSELICCLIERASVSFVRDKSIGS
jgi:hypothetical protein